MIPGARTRRKRSKSWKRSSPKVGLVGAGRVGSAFLFQLKKKGYHIAGVVDSNPAAARRAYRLIGQNYESLCLCGLAGRSNVIFIATPDREIGKVYQQLYQYLKPGTVVVHCSGALSTDIFKPKKAVQRLSLHPLQTFPELKSAIAALPGSYFALEGDRPALRLGKQIVRDLQGTALLVPKKSKPLYHAMCVFAANFLVVLLSRAEAIGKKLRLKNPLKALMPMVIQTLANIENVGTVHALSGPVERAEVEAVETHLKALKKYTPELLDFYIAMSRHALVLATKKGGGAMHRARLKALGRYLQAWTVAPPKKITIPFPISL